MIEVDDVAVELGGTRVLDGVDAEVEAGEFVGLVGPNGAGKTTLLRAINGRIAPDRGEVRIDGAPVEGLSARELGRRVATVPQETTLAFEFDVRTVVEMGRNPHVGRLDLHDPGRDRVDRALERTRTAGFQDRSVTTLSGGERQRVLLARALAQEAPVLLLDEPTANLDVNHQVATLDLVSGLIEEGKTALAAIHDLDLAARYCDELLLLYEGAVRAAGPPEDVLSAPSVEEAFGTRVAVSRNPVTGSPTVTALSAPGADLDAHVHVIAGGGSAAALLYPLVGAGLEVTVGPLHEGDPDAETADLLGVEAVTADPFAPFDPEATARGEDAAASADVTVLAPLDVGPANVAALEVAAASDRLVVVEESGSSFAERNHAGEEARRRYRRLHERARVASPEAVVDAVAAALDAGVERALPIED